jgi:hypothetical protein
MKAADPLETATSVIITLGYRARCTVPDAKTWGV